MARRLISAVNPFAKLFSIDIILLLYLGIWNAVTPVFIATRYGANWLVVYEITLSAISILAMLVLAPVLESLRRSRACAPHPPRCFSLSWPVRHHLR